MVDLESMAAAKDTACRARPVAAGHPSNEETKGAEIVQASFFVVRKADLVSRKQR
jgi:hypothetical protein